MQVAESCEVIFAHQDVRVSQWWQVIGFGIYFVFHLLERHKKEAMSTHSMRLKRKKRQNKVKIDG